MQRTVLMVRPEQRAKLTQLAAHAHVSAAEINRRAIDAYDPLASHEEEEVEELMLGLLIESSTRALQALNEASQAVQETVRSIRQQREA